MQDFKISDVQTLIKISFVFKKEINAYFRFNIKIHSSFHLAFRQQKETNNNECSVPGSLFTPSLRAVLRQFLCKISISKHQDSFLAQFLF